MALSSTSFASEFILRRSTPAAASSASGWRKLLLRALRNLTLRGLPRIRWLVVTADTFVLRFRTPIAMPASVFPVIFNSTRYSPPPAASSRPHPSSKLILDLIVGVWPDHAASCYSVSPSITADSLALPAYMTDDQHLCLSLLRPFGTSILETRRLTLTPRHHLLALPGSMTIAIAPPILLMDGELPSSPT